MRRFLALAVLTALAVSSPAFGQNYYRQLGPRYQQPQYRQSRYYQPQYQQPQDQQPQYQQPVQNQNMDPAQLVRSWYNRFLGHDPEPAVYSVGWVRYLRTGTSPQWVLARILASDGYYQKNGSTPDGYMHALFRDLGIQEPSPQDFQAWVNLASANRIQVAEQLLQDYPATWQPPNSQR